MSEQTSPPDHFTIIYKLGTLEALVTTGMNNIKTQLDDVKKLVENNKQETQKELEGIKTRLDRIEDWKQAVIERVTVITGVVLFAWAVVGDAVKNFVTGLFH